MEKDKDRFTYLDSIRGIAASMVLLYHIFLLYDADASPIRLGIAFNSISNFLFYLTGKLANGRAAVMVFFVLSGFVLSYSLRKHTASYAAYLIKRFFRIYPAFLAALLISYALHYWIGVRHDVVSGFFRRDVLNPDMSCMAFIKHMAMWGTPDAKGLESVMWSLVHEIRISIFFPLIFVSIQKYRWKAVLAYFALSVACTVTLFLTTGSVANGLWEETVPATFLASGYYISFFAAGSWLAVERQAVSRFFAGLPRPGIVLFSAAVVACLWWPRPAHDSFKANLMDWANGVGAVGLIALAMEVKNFSSVLNHAALAWLGRVSYSLYLLHLPVLYAVNQLSDGTWPFGVTVIVASVLSLATAELLARLVEFPAIQAGKKLSARYLKTAVLPVR